MSDEEKARLVERHLEGVPLRLLSSLYGTSIAEVCRIIDESGKGRSKGPQRPGTVPYRRRERKR